MAKVIAPLGSFEASGSIAGAFTYGKNKGRNIVRVKATPANPRTPGQVAVRASFAGLVALFQANSLALMSAFADRAKQLQTSEFAAFIGFSQTRLSLGLGPALVLLPTDAAPAANGSIDAADVTGKFVTLSVTHSVSADAWGLYVYRKLGADPAGIRDELVAFLPLAATQFVDGPLAAGTWHYAVAAASNHGGIHAVSAATSAVVA